MLHILSPLSLTESLNETSVEAVVADLVEALLVAALGELVEIY